MQQPDYKNYSISDLVDALEHVDKTAYPERARELKEELDKRRDEAMKILVRPPSPVPPASFKLPNDVSMWLQVVSTLLLVLFVTWIKRDSGQWEFGTFLAIYMRVDWAISIPGSSSDVLLSTTVFGYIASIASHAFRGTKPTHAQRASMYLSLFACAGFLNESLRVLYGYELRFLFSMPILVCAIDWYDRIVQTRLLNSTTHEVPSNQPLHPTPTADEAPASGAGERRR